MMGSYMHLLCKETRCSVEAWKHSGGGEIVEEIESEKSLIAFLKDHEGKILNLVWDGCLQDFDEWDGKKCYEDGFRLPKEQKDDS